MGLQLGDSSTVEKKRYGVEHSSSTFLRTLSNGGSSEEGKTVVYKELAILALQ